MKTVCAEFAVVNGVLSTTNIVLAQPLREQPTGPGKGHRQSHAWVVSPPSAANRNHDGTRLATGSKDKTARIWDVTVAK